MLLEILKRTPTWVFVLFAVLVFFGYMPPWLATGVSFAYGLMSGAFLARALRIFSARAANSQP